MITGNKDGSKNFMVHLAGALEDLKTAHQDPVWEYKRGGSWVTYDANSTARLEEAARQGKAEKTVTLLAKAVPVDLSRMVHKTDEEELVRRTGLRTREKLNCLNQVSLSLCFTVFASFFRSFSLFFPLRCERSVAIGSTTERVTSWSCLIN